MYIHIPLCMGILLLVQLCKGHYTLLYGGIVALNIRNVTIKDPDVLEAVKLVEKRNKLDDTKCSVTNIEKQRLYFTTDGVSPLVYEHLSHINGRAVLERSQMVLGLTYSFSLICNGSHWSSRVLEYDFIVSRDRNRDYHIFKQASLEDSKIKLLRHSIIGYHDLSEETNTCSNRVTPLFFIPPLQQHLPVNFSVQSLLVASYNIWNVNSVNAEGESYEMRLKRLRKLIASINADVFGFQEVRLEVATKMGKKQKYNKKSVSTRSQVFHLAKHLHGYQFVYQPAMLYMEKYLERKEEGLAIFSRYPIISSDYRLLYRNSSDEIDSHQRICLHAELLTPHFGPVHIFVSHLSLSEPAQERSVVEIWKYMQSFSGIKFLLGDMNAEPDSKAIRFLTGKVSIGGVWTDNLHDTWYAADAKINVPGFTFSALEDQPIKRIDYIFSSLPHSSKVSIAISKVIVDKNICFLPCSDHHILLTVLNPAFNNC